MDNKFVITIGRQFGSCGKEIKDKQQKLKKINRS